MKKFYTLLVLVSILNVSLVNAQEYFSFEAEEGYTLGNIDGQQGWTTTGLGNGERTELQIITDELTKIGERSLKINHDPQASSQPLPIMGAFHSLDTPLDRTNFSMSYSINVANPPGANSSIFALECGSIVDEKLVLEIYFSYDGRILILENAGDEFIVTEIGNWQEDTWYDIAISGEGEVVSYYLNGELKHEGALLYNIDDLRFAHDNFSGSAFFDDISINYAPLGVQDVSATSWNIYPNPVESVLNLSGLEEANSLTIFDISGKKLEQFNEFTNQIDLSHLQNGIYLLQLDTQNGPVTKKFIKK